MSVSKKKNLKTEAALDQLTERELKKQEAEKAKKRSTLTYTVVGIICAVFCVSLLIWNSGLIQRHATAMTIGDQKYTAADVQYYYASSKASIINYYLQNYGFTPYNYQSSAKEQIYNSETGETWYDYLMEEAITSMKTSAAANAAAKAEGFTLSEEGQASVDASLADLETVWIGSYPNRNAYLRAVYGPYMTYNRYVELLTQDMLAVEYTSKVTETFEYDDADYDAYYAEHANELDNFTFSQFILRAQVSTLDDDGNVIDRTDEELAALVEEAKIPVEAKAKEIEAALLAGNDPAVVAVQYTDDLYSNNIHIVRTGASLSTTYSDWMYDSTRQVGDVTLTEYDGGSVVYYYVIVFEGRDRDDSATADVRHILIDAELDDGASAPTDEQYDVAYDEAEALLNEWKAGEATEESFAALAVEHSADTSSASNGGLITGINSLSGYVETFQNWALSEDRVPGDVGIVQNTGSSIMGWHLMYYVGDGDPLWKISADNALFNEAYTNWSETLIEGYDAAEGFGMKFVQG